MDTLSTAAAGTYRTAATGRGATDTTVSAQWARRPADERFLDLASLRAAVATRTAQSTDHTVEPTALTVVPTGGDLLFAPPRGEPCTATHWSFGQLCALADGTSADQVRKTAGYGPVGLKIAAATLQLGLKAREAGPLAAYVRENGTTTLRAVTSRKYARIHDLAVVDTVMELVDSDPRWKVPGMLDWASGCGGTYAHNPCVDVTRDTTTLYASDRDVWLFLCQDADPLRIGTLPDGSPDLVFRGFIVSNSEVGAQKFHLKTFLLRGVCCNRIIWGQEQVKAIAIRHVGEAGETFRTLAGPALRAYADAGSAAFIGRIHAAQAAKVGGSEGEVLDWLMGRPLGFSRTQALKVMRRVRTEEGRDARSVWDVVQGITAIARDIGHQDRRVPLESLAGRLLDTIDA
ncbi:MAG TPA: DUF932 domain-containing protein [Azospirillum sp.]